MYLFQGLRSHDKVFASTAHENLREEWVEPLEGYYVIVPRLVKHEYGYIWRDQGQVGCYQKE